MAVTLKYCSSGTTAAGTAASDTNDGGDNLGLPITAGTLEIDEDFHAVVTQATTCAQLYAATLGMPRPLNIPVRVNSWPSGSGGVAGRFRIRDCTPDSVTLGNYTWPHNDPEGSSRYEIEAGTVPAMAGTGTVAFSTGPYRTPHKWHGTTVSPAVTAVATGTIRVLCMCQPYDDDILFTNTREWVWDSNLSALTNMTASAMHRPYQIFGCDCWGNPLNYAAGEKMDIYPAANLDIAPSTSTDFAGTSAALKIKSHSSGTRYYELYGLRIHCTHPDNWPVGNAPADVSVGYDTGIAEQLINSTGVLRVLYQHCEVVNINASQLSDQADYVRGWALGQTSADVRGSTLINCHVGLTDEVTNQSPDAEPTCGVAYGFCDEASGVVANSHFHPTLNGCSAFGAQVYYYHYSCQTAVIVGGFANQCSQMIYQINTSTKGVIAIGNLSWSTRANDDFGTAGAAFEFLGPGNQCIRNAAYPTAGNSYYGFKYPTTAAIANAVFPSTMNGAWPDSEFGTNMTNFSNGWTPGWQNVHVNPVISIVGSPGRPRLTSGSPLVLNGPEGYVIGPAPAPSGSGGSLSSRAGFH